MKCRVSLILRMREVLQVVMGHRHQVRRDLALIVPPSQFESTGREIVTQTGLAQSK